MSRPLKERLASRYEAQGWDEHGPAVDSHLVNPDGPEALARIERLEGALREIAKGEAPPEQHGHYVAHRAAVDLARAALNEEA